MVSPTAQELHISSDVPDAEKLAALKRFLDGPDRATLESMASTGTWLVHTSKKSSSRAQLEWRSNAHPDKPVTKLGAMDVIRMLRDLPVSLPLFDPDRSRIFFFSQGGAPPRVARKGDKVAAA